MKMKKRFLSILLSLVMVLGLMPGMSLMAYAESDALYTFAGDTSGSSFYYNITEINDTNASKIKTIEALVWVTGNPDWGFIQVASGGSIKQYIYDNLNKGIHKYIWNVDSPTQTVLGEGSYAQIQLVQASGNAESGKLLAYRVEFSDSTGTITKGDWGNPICVAPTGLTATYGQTLADVTLNNPAGNTAGTWAWVNSTTSVGGVGTNTFSATFTPNDSSLHTVTNITVPVTVSAHAHNFTYSANGVTITATCSDTSCALHSSPATLTLSATDMTYTGSAYAGASLSDTTAWTAAGLTVPTIEYEGRGETHYTKNATAPTDAGSYTASITLGGVTAQVSYTIRIFQKYDLWVGGTQVTSENAGDIPAANGTMTGTASYDAATNTLTLNNYVYEGTGSSTFSGQGVAAIYYTGQPLTVKLSGSNKLTVPQTNMDFAYGILNFSGPKTLTFSGDGSLKIECPEAAEISYGISSTGHVVIDGPMLEIITGDKGIGIYCSSGLAVEMKAGALYSKGGRFAINCAFSQTMFGQGTTKTDEKKLIPIGNTPVNLEGYAEVLYPHPDPYAKVTTAPAANTLTYNGRAQALVTAGTATGGTMKYAVTMVNQEPSSDAYTFDNTYIPTGTDAGT